MAEQVIRCAGDGCEAFFADFHGQGGASTGGGFTLATSTVDDLSHMTSLMPHTGSIVLYTILVIVSIILYILLRKTFFTIEQQSVEMIERFGKYHRTALTGLNIKIPYIDKRARKLSLRVYQLPIQVETKTLDNVFVTLSVAIQYRILETALYDAAYKLQDATAQIKSYVFDIVRGLVPKITLDSTFAQKDDISKEVLTELNEKMSTYGYIIINTPITEIEPEARVKAAMNDINVAQREQAAATARGEAQKTITVKHAEAAKEANVLHGQGIAGQRKAIVVGLKESIEQFKEAVPGINDSQVMQTVMMTQYFDMLKDLPSEGKVILLNHSPQGMHDIASQLRESLLVTNERG